MPQRAVVAREMASLLGVLAHPHRVRIIEELRNGEMDVNSLQDILGVSHSRVSQHLSVLRSHRIVTERREGRHVFYRLLHPNLAKWILDGLVFLSAEQQMGREIREAVESTLQMWSGSEAPPPKGNGHPSDDHNVTN
jgi:DNA-binding transcriptional ArsR family regulator